jgi:hypothetical protein
MSAKSTVIDGVTFQVAPFMAVEALKLKVCLVKTFGPALGALLSQGGGALASGIEKLMGVLDEDSFIALLRRLLGNTVAHWEQGGKSRAASFAGEYFDAALESVFSGRLFSVYRLILFVLEANYPDFFSQVIKILDSILFVCYTVKIRRAINQDNSLFNSERRGGEKQPGRGIGKGGRGRAAH